MSDIAISVTVFACVFAGALLGIYTSRRSARASSESRVIRMSCS